MNHRRFTVEHPLVHVDVHDLRTVLDLLPRNLHASLVITLENGLGEFRAASDVGAFANIHKIGGRKNLEHLETGITWTVFNRGAHSRFDITQCIGKCLDVRGCRAAATTDNVQKSSFGVILEHPSHECGRLVVLAHLVRQASIRVQRHERTRDFRERRDVFAHHFRPECTVQPNRQKVCVRQRRVKRLDRLARKRASTLIGDRARKHDRHSSSRSLERILDSGKCGLGVQGVKDRFDQQHIHATLEQGQRLFFVREREFVKGYGPKRWVFHLRTHARRAVCWPERPRHETRFVRLKLREFVRCPSSNPRTLEVEFVDPILHLVIGLSNPRAAERVRTDDVRARRQKRAVNLEDDLWARDRKQVVVALQWARQEFWDAEIFFLEFVLLDHGSHRAIQDQDALEKKLFESWFHSFNALLGEVASSSFNNSQSGIL